MKVDLNDFSKSGLVQILNAARDKNFLTDKAFADMLRHDLIRRVLSIKKEVDSLRKRIDTERKRLSLRSPKKKRDAYNKRVDRYNNLIKRGNRQFFKIEEIEKAYPELKKKE